MAKTKTEHVVKAVDSDRQLAEHLRVAEENLIAAAKLFELKKAPKRTHDFVAKLFRMQEGVTSLYRQELVRIRGPIKMTLSAKRKK